MKLQLLKKQKKKMAQLTIKDKFKIEYGNHEINNKSILGIGNNIVISSKGSKNGVYGFFDYDITYKAPFITVPRTGSIGEAFVQSIDCAVDDNCLVMFPKQEMLLSTLYVYASYIRQQKWRFKYGRQITPTRLGNMPIPPLVMKDESFNQKKKEILDASESLKKKYFQHKDSIIKFTNSGKHEIVNIKKLFHVKNGKSIGISNYEEGSTPYISSGEQNNGVIGFINSSKDELFPKYSITVSAFCKAHIQPFNFVARGNGGSSVKVLIPINKMDLLELLWYQLEIDKQNWRFSYGKMISKSRLEEFQFGKFNL